MPAIINDTSVHCNTQSSQSSNNLQRLPSAAFKLLKILYDDRCSGLENSRRSRREYAFIIKRSEATVSRAFTYLCELGYVGSDSRQGQQYAIRWITRDGFNWLDNKTSHQMSHQIVDILYIDLSKREEKDNLKILNEPHICGKLNEELNITVDDKLDRFLEQQRTSFEERKKIRLSIKASKIGPVRTERLIARVDAVTKKKPIMSLNKYIDGCIANERKEMTSLFDVLRGKNLPFHEYGNL